MLRVDFVTLFPEMILGALSHSIMGRAQASGAVAFGCSNPRDHATDRHKSVDDASYGGGPGMVMMAPLVEAALLALSPAPGAAIVLCDARGERFTQPAAATLADKEHVVFLCGHYEGVDERVREHLASHCYSLGDFVVTGGELPALVMADATVRLLPGVLGDPESHLDDSFSDRLLGFPLYTRPEEWRGSAVPPVLLSGHHEEIRKWRRREQLLATRRYRPDLLARAELSAEDLALL